MIGIIGGVGPLAGIDIVKKIIEETSGNKDQDHVPFLLSSQAHRIVDRTAFLLGKEKTNPGIAIADIALELEKSGANIIGIPCNTAHSPEIFNVIQDQLREKGSKVKLLHMIQQTVEFIQKNFPIDKIGVLCTTGTKSTHLYKNAIESNSLICIEPNEELQTKVHLAIYDETYGIKANSSPVTNRAHDSLVAAIQELKTQGAQVIILGCTELPLALQEKSYFGLPVIDPNRILARALIHELDPGKLKPLA